MHAGSVSKVKQMHSHSESARWVPELVYLLRSLLPSARLTLLPREVERSGDIYGQERFQSSTF